MNLVETVNCENEKDANGHSHEVSWPIDGALGIFENSVEVRENQIGVYIGDEALEDFEMPSENNHSRSEFYDHRSQKYSENVTDTTRYDSNARESDYTKHFQHQNHYQQDQRPRRSIIRVLNRPLLDLDDDDECLDAIEVERQNTDNSHDQEPEAKTSYASDKQVYRIDPPDPLPADRHPEGRRLSTVTPTLNDTTDAPEGATKEEIDLLNRFIDVASSDFGGQTLSAESEARVRSAALKVGLTSKFVDQLLKQTMKPLENQDHGLTFDALPEQQQPPLYDDKNDHNNNYSYPHQYDGDYGGENETYYTADHSQSNTKQSRRLYYDDCNFNIWEVLGKNLAHLANVTAKTCGVNYHRKNRNRDDGDSIVSAISFEDDHAKLSTTRRGRSRRSREENDRVAASVAPSIKYNNQEQRERIRHVTFDDNIAEQNYDRTEPFSMDVVQNNSPPREKITQLV